LIPEELVDEMIKTMPEHHGPGNDEDRSLPKYDYVTFMNRLMGSPGGGNANGTNGK